MNFGIEARVPYLDQNMIENYLFLSEKKSTITFYRIKVFKKNI